MCTEVVYVCLHVGCVHACMRKPDCGASEKQGSTSSLCWCAPPHSLRLQTCAALPGILHNFWGSNLRSSCLHAGTLPDKTPISSALYLFFNCLFEVGSPHLAPNLQSVLSLLPILWHHRLAPSHPSYIRVLWNSFLRGFGVGGRRGKQSYKNWWIKNKNWG